MVELGDAGEFLALMDTVSMKPMLSGSQNLTLFVPTDEAIEDFRHDLENFNRIEEPEYNVDDGLLRLEIWKGAF